MFCVGLCVVELEAWHEDLELFYLCRMWTCIATMDITSRRSVVNNLLRSQVGHNQCQSVSVGVPISDIGEVEITEVGACRLIIQLCTL